MKMESVRTKRFLISELRAAEYNPRSITKVQMEELRRSMLEYGVVQPIVVNIHEGRYGVVVGGHQRLKVLKGEGVTEIDCVIVDLPVEKERNLNLRLNRNNGQFDEDLLKTYFNKEELMEAGFIESDLKFMTDKGKQAIEDELAKYDIVERVDEGYDGIILFSKSNIDTLWLREFFGLKEKRSYKIGKVGETRVVGVEDFRAALKRYLEANTQK